MQKLMKKRGFTLIEILVVIGIIAILATIVLIAINPARQFAQANNTQRESNVTAILNAIGQYAADNKGDISALDIDGTPDEISDSGADICSDLVPTYIPALPFDPKADPFEDCPSEYNTMYKVSKNGDGRIVVTAPETEDVDPGSGVTPDITVTR